MRRSAGNAPRSGARYRTAFWPIFWRAARWTGRSILRVWTWCGTVYSMCLPSQRTIPPSTGMRRWTRWPLQRECASFGCRTASSYIREPTRWAARSFARVFSQINSYRPRIYIRYSSVHGPFIVPRYEDRPLQEGIKAQITSLGGVVLDAPGDSDCMLAVNSPESI